MGTVHGVYLKYVGISAASCAGFFYLLGNDFDLSSTRQELGHLLRSKDYFRIGSVLCLGYSCVLNGAVAVLFKLETGMGILGKDTDKPDEPAKREVVPVASMVQPGWYVGGCYAHQLNKEWACVIDLTVEFPESCINTTKEYMSKPTWDGVPATPEQLEEAAIFAVEARKKHGGDVLVHCAHGRGRSTTVMCACLVKEGLFKNWEEAFEIGIKPGRPVCKLNARMRQNLMDWQAIYVDKDDRKGK